MADKGTDRRGLGRGLSALMGDVQPPATHSATPEAAAAGERTVPIEAIAPNPDQPRTDFDSTALEELTDSIKEKGILQPILVRPNPNAKPEFQIVAGERRWRAAQKAQLHVVPIIIKSFTDLEAMEIAIVENIQRDDLNAVEEAKGYRRLMDHHKRTQEDMAQALGKSRSHIANTLRLLQLPDEVLAYIRSGQLSAGHARALITAEDPVSAAREIVARGLSVRKAEALAKAGKKPAAGAKNPAKKKSADTRAIEGDLSASLGMKVSIDADPNQTSGKVTVRYKDLDQLDDLCRVLASSVRAGSI